MMTTKIAIAGLGVVGQEVFRYIQNGGDTQGVALEVVGVSARDRDKANSLLNLSGYHWYDSPVDMLKQTEPDIMVELIGGSEGVAYDIAKAAAEQKVNLVTANKALLAVHANEFALLTNYPDFTIAYEAAVCAEIPIIKTLREERQKGTNITMIQGILNGTCNFILSKMQEKGMSYEDALEEAQRLGYAEQDPTLDVNGTDSAHKLVLLASLAFGAIIDLHRVEFEGIENISVNKLQNNKDDVYRLVAHAEIEGNTINAHVQAGNFSCNDPFAEVNGTNNAIIYRIDKSTLRILKGQGAGGEATRESVIADIIDLARGNSYPLFGRHWSHLLKWTPNGTYGELY